MMKSYTTLDSDQIVRYKYDEADNADRVKIVGIEGLKEGIIESLKGLKLQLPDDFQSMKPAVQEPHYKFIPSIVKETQVVEVIKYLPQIQIERVEVPTIIKETEFKYIDRPIITETVKIVEIEKPVMVTEYKELPKGIFLSLGILFALNLGLLIVLICK